MEAVAAVASIAGIITLVGQSIDGLIRFREFFSDISSASKTVSRLLADVNSLIQILRNVGDVLHRVEARRNDQNFASLDIKLEDCTKDVKIWLETAKALRPGSETGGRALMKKFRLAVKNEAVVKIREEIGRHRQALCLSLAVFGRTIDLHTSEQIYQMRGRFDDALTTSLSNHGAHEEALRRIEHYSITSMRTSAHSIESMDSIRTELSRLEAMITGSKVTLASRVEESESHVLVNSTRSESRSRSSEIRKDEFEGRLNADGPAGRLSESSDSRSSLRASSNGSRYSRNGNGHVDTNKDTRNRTRTHPSDYRYLVKEQEVISKRFSEISNGHESALLYAESFRTTPPESKARTGSSSESKDLKQVSSTEGDAHSNPRNDKYSMSCRSSRSGGCREAFADNLMAKTSLPSRSARTSVSQGVDDRSSGSCYQSPQVEAAPSETNHSAIYAALQESLTNILPAPIFDYISLQHLVSLCEGHLNLVEHRLRVTSNSGIGNEGRGVVNNTISAESSARKLREHLEQLQDAVDASGKQCVGAGYSLLELDSLMSPSSTHSRVLRQDDSLSHTATNNGRISQKVHLAQCSTADNDSGDDSEKYFSCAE